METVQTSLPFYLEERIQRIQLRERWLLVVAGLFVLISGINYSLVAEGRLSLSHLAAPLLWAAVVAAAHVVLNRFQPLRDPLFLPLAGLLMGWGLVLVDRLAANFLWRQTIWVLLGTAAMVGIALWPRPRPGDPAGLRWLRRYRYTWLLGGLLLLALTLVFGVNPSGSGLRFWLGVRLPLLGGVYFQPSELLKLLAAVYLASYMADKRGFIHIETREMFKLRVARPPLAYLAPLLLMWGVSLLLLGWQRDLGAAILFFSVFLVMLYLASGRWEAAASGVLLLAIMVALSYLLPISQLSIVRLRIDTWLNPWPEAQDRAFQVVQSLLALASGGLAGQGVGQGYPIYIPVVHSDFALAAVAEEWGLVGAVAITLCMAVLVYRGLRLAALARRPFFTFLAAALASFLGIQSLVIMGGITRLLPLTGITLPFLSYGGSSMLVSSLMVGLLIKMSGEVLAE